MRSAVKVLATTVCALGIIVASATAAHATSIQNPDLSFIGTSFTYDGTNFGASCVDCIFSWTTPTGAYGGTSIGDFSLNWKPTISDFSFQLIDDGGFSGITGTLLYGTVTSFAGNLFSPGPGAAFAGTLLLATSNLGFGNLANFNFSSFDATATGGTADVDIKAAIPEPATLSLLGLGTAIMAVRRRRKSGSASPS